MELTLRMKNFSLVIGYVGCDASHVEVSVGKLALLIAQTEAVAAVPEQPPPPAVHLHSALGAALLAAEQPTIFVFDVLITTAAKGILKYQHYNFCVTAFSWS